MAKGIALNIPDMLLEQLDKMIAEGLFKTRTEAIKEGVRLLIQKREIKKLKGKILYIKTDTEDLSSLTQAVVKQHEEDDVL